MTSIDPRQNCIFLPHYCLPEMRNFLSGLSLFFSFIFSLTSNAQVKPVKILTVPAGNRFSVIDTAGISILPSGRFVTPAGTTIRITHDPFGMAISPDKRKAVTLHNGVFTIIDLTTLGHTRVPSYDGKISSPLSNGSFLGVAFAPNSKSVFLSGGDNGAVIVYDIEKMQRTDSISLNGTVNGDKLDREFLISSSQYEGRKIRELTISEARTNAK